MELGYLLLATLLILPVLVFIIMRKIGEMHKDTLSFLRDTQVVGGQPRELLERRQELVAEQTKDARDRAAYLSDEMKRRTIQHLGG